MAGDLKPPLPRLRDDITLARQSPLAGGEANWRIRDPLQHRFFSVSDDTGALLSIWNRASSFTELVSLAREKLGIELSAEAFGQLVEFLEGANLLSSGGESLDRLRSKGDSARAQGRKALLMAFLSYRIPLLNPERLLRFLRPVTGAVCSWSFAVLAACAALFGLYASFFELLDAAVTELARLNLAGLVQILAALVILKSFHELGHAVVASRYGCRVPAMGVAFMAFMPMLYTDVTDAWRLQSKWARMHVAAAGVMTELALASFATLAWTFLEDGPARDVAFYIATVGWIGSLLFNLNPLARFDGYYVLADVIGMENLGARAGRMSQWRLRRFLLFPDLPPPENFAPRTASLMAAFGAASWLYRLTIFAGIALVLYGVVGKAIGALMVLAAFVVMLALPAWKEAAEWRKLAASGQFTVRPGRPAMIAAGILALLFVPFSGTVRAPAVLAASDVQKVFAPRPARIAEIGAVRDAAVSAGDLLVRFDAPELSAELRETQIRLEAARRQLSRAASSRTDRAQMGILQDDVAALERQLAGLKEEAQQLSVTSLWDGKVVQVSRGIREGAWTPRDRWVAILRSGRGATVMGYVSERDLLRIRPGSRGRFVPDDPSRMSAPLTLTRIGGDAASRLQLPELASSNGGPVETLPEKDGSVAPAHRVFPVEFAVDPGTPAPRQIVTGTAVFDGRRESIAAALLRRLAQVLVRESVM